MAETKPEVLTRFQAQRAFGLFAPYDGVMVALIVFIWITLGFWVLFGNPTALNLIALALVDMFLTQCWLVVLAFRILTFVLDTHADISLMPEAAARIVTGYIEGRPPPPKKN